MALPQYPSTGPNCALLGGVVVLCSYAYAHMHMPSTTQNSAPAEALFIFVSKNVHLR